MEKLWVKGVNNKWSDSFDGLVMWVRVGRQKYTEKGEKVCEIWQESPISVNSVTPCGRASRIWISREDAEEWEAIPSALCAGRAGSAEHCSITSGAAEISSTFQTTNLPFPAPCSCPRVLKHHFSCSHRIVCACLQFPGCTKLAIFYKFSLLSSQLLQPAEDSKALPAPAQSTKSLAGSRGCWGHCKRKF